MLFKRNGKLITASTKSEAIKIVSKITEVEDSNEKQLNFLYRKLIVNSHTYTLKELTSNDKDFILKEFFKYITLPKTFSASFGDKYINIKLDKDNVFKNGKFCSDSDYDKMIKLNEYFNDSISEVIEDNKETNKENIKIIQNRKVEQLRKRKNL